MIKYGADEYIVLRGVALNEWQAGSSSQIIGGVADDELAGNAAANVFAGGGGDDTIIAGSGNDRINYASGNDVIQGDLYNQGTDTLDLRQFSLADVQFSVDGSDVLILTPRGLIRLGSQVLYGLGDVNSNIEVILFADQTLDEAGIRGAAYPNGEPSLDDNLVGTVAAEFIDGRGRERHTSWKWRQ